MTASGSASATLDGVRQSAREAWTRLRDELRATLGVDLVAMWAHGGTVAPDAPYRAADLDTYVILDRPPAEQSVERIEAGHDAIARDLSVEWDAWYVLADDARRPDPPRHAYRPQRRDTAWAINRAHWLAGRYVQLHGPEPAEIVPAPTWREIQIDLSRELEHIERHVAEGDTDSYEATYAILNGSRILHAVQTGDAALSKHEAGEWALAHLSGRWHEAVQAARRAYAGAATADDAALLAAQMAPFVAMVRERLPAHEGQSSEGFPRWSGY